MSPLEWAEPGPSEADDAGWELPRERLRRCPGRWAMVHTAATDTRADQLARDIVRGWARGSLPAEDFAAVSRGVRVYARHVGSGYGGA